MVKTGILFNSLNPEPEGWSTLTLLCSIWDVGPYKFVQIVTYFKRSNLFRMHLKGKTILQRRSTKTVEAKVVLLVRNGKPNRNEHLRSKLTHWSFSKGHSYWIANTKLNIFFLETTRPIKLKYAKYIFTKISKAIEI